MIRSYADERELMNMVNELLGIQYNIAKYPSGRNLLRRRNFLLNAWEDSEKAGEYMLSFPVFYNPFPFPNFSEVGKTWGFHSKLGGNQKLQLPCREKQPEKKIPLPSSV